MVLPAAGVATALPPPAARLDHVAIHVADLERSVRFYRALFGFREIAAPFSGARWLDMGNGLALHIVAGRTAPLDGEKWDHIAIACSDMAVMTVRLDAMRIPWSDIDGKHAPQVRPDGVKQIFVRDPDGYWIEINDGARAGR